MYMAVSFRELSLRTMAVNQFGPFGFSTRNCPMVTFPSDTDTASDDLSTPPPRSFPTSETASQ